MSYQLSLSLGELFQQFDDNATIDLSKLARQVAELFEGKEAASSMLGTCAGNIRYETLSRYLFDCVVYDSVVRDILTTGHLAKLLSRLDILKQTSNLRIVGLPHSIFDQRSQMERSDYFGRNNILPIDANVLEVEGVRAMLEREKRAIQKG